MTNSSRTADGAAPRDTWVAVGLVAALVAAFFTEALFGHRTFFLLDVLTEELPNHHWLHRHGFSPWNPLLFAGQPFLGNPQAYPFDVLHVLSLAFPAVWGFNAFIVSHYAVSALGCLGFLRAQRCSLEAACFGAIAWALGGFLVSAGHLPTVLNTTTWLPWMLWLWPLAAQPHARPRHRAFAALATAASLLGGEPQFWLMNVTLCGALVLATQPHRGGALLRMGEVVAFSLGLAAIQLVPFADYLQHSDRTAPFTLADQARWALAPGTFWSLLVPHHFPSSERASFGLGFWEANLPYLHSIYPGIGVTLLAAGGLAVLRDARWRWALVFVFLGASLAPGPSSPLFSSAFTVFPPMARFRFPEKYWFLAALPLVLLGAAAFDRALAQISQRRMRLAFAVSATALLGFGLAFPLLDAPTTDAADSFVATHLPESLARSLMLLTVATGAAAWLSHRRLVAAVWIAALSADLWFSHRHVNPTLPLEALAQTPPAARWLLANAPDARILTLQSRTPEDQHLSREEPLERFFLRQRLQLGAPTALEFGLNDLFAAYSLAPAARQAWISSFQKDPALALREAGVDYVVSPYPFSAPELERVFAEETPAFGASTYLYRNLGSPGRLRVEPASLGRVTAFDRTNTRLHVATESSAPATLVIAETFHPGWSARVDGGDVAVQPTGAGFMALTLPPGVHRVELTFRSLALEAGVGLSLLALVALTIRTWLSERAREPTPESLRRSPSA